MNRDVLQYIFNYLSPRDLFTIMPVNNLWYTCATMDPVWERHKRRVLNKYPDLNPYFTIGEPICRTYNTLNVDFRYIQNQGLLCHIYRRHVQWLFSGKSTVSLSLTADGDFNTGVIDTLTPFYELSDGTICKVSPLNWDNSKIRERILVPYYNVLQGVDRVEPKRKRIKRIE